MSANRAVRRELGLDEFKDAAMEALGTVPGLTLTLDNGDAVTIPHPMLLDDDLQERVTRVQQRRDLDWVDAESNPYPLGANGFPVREFIGGKLATENFSVRFAKSLLGEADYARFLAGGGNANLVAMAWSYLTKALDNDPKVPR